MVSKSPARGANRLRSAAGSGAARRGTAATPRRNSRAAQIAARRTTGGDATKKAILAAAATRFASGYETTTMRQIAKDAGCSHTAIYLYFADKEALLAELSMAPIGRLRSTVAKNLAKSGPAAGGSGGNAVEKTAARMGASGARSVRGRDVAAERLRAAGLEYIRFGLRHRAIYEVLVEASATRVDSAASATPLNRLRLEVFGLLSSALADALGVAANDERALEFGRIFFYVLHGIVSTYDQSSESAESVRRRLSPTFDKAIQVCLAGLRAGM